MPMLDLGPAASEVVRLLRGTRGDQLADPTPCEDTTVGALLDHFLLLSLAFTQAARKAPPSGAGTSSPPPKADASHLDPAWRALLPTRLDVLVAAWRDPAAWQGQALAGGITMPAEVMGVVAVDELVLHGWDLARATTQEFRCDPASTAAVLAFTALTAQPDQVATRNGLFGPVVPVAEDAPELDRALGFAGRDPSWTSPAHGTVLTGNSHSSSSTR
jgi:uncharacterized protein (TIGR03086 family)